MNFELDAVSTRQRSKEGVAITIYRLDTFEPYVVNGETVTITILGPDSDDYRKELRARTERRLKEAASGVELDEDAFRIGILAAMTKAWTGIFHKGTADPVPCTPDAAAELYVQIPAIRERMETAFNNRANFMTPSSNS